MESHCMFNIVLFFHLIIYHTLFWCNILFSSYNWKKKNKHNKNPTCLLLPWWLTQSWTKMLSLPTQFLKDIWHTFHELLTLPAEILFKLVCGIQSISCLYLCSPVFEREGKAKERQSHLGKGLKEQAWTLIKLSTHIALNKSQSLRTHSALSYLYLLSPIQGFIYLFYTFL